MAMAREQWHNQRATLIVFRLSSFQGPGRPSWKATERAFLSSFLLMARLLFLLFLDYWRDSELGTELQQAFVVRSLSSERSRE
jgi:hypothetical protein